MPMTRVSVKGQVVIPKTVRETLGLRPGARLVVDTEGDRIVLTPVPKQIGNRLFGRYQGVDLLADLKDEHTRERARERRIREHAPRP